MTEEIGATVSRMISLGKSHPDAGAGSDYNEFFFCGILLTEVPRAIPSSNFVIALVYSSSAIQGKETRLSILLMKECYK